ncbi:hypothetical protein JTE90_010437 [Oedothorax gibbosus]|uniref:Uncharacterized protein n=1 Tax=Oedothorax gibbosus TaxID=931172 RepID=A0AAV6W5J2_9ARAC|nr:hypothetical protein JTE90_010437 [Oedothorax gibbosus]
MSDIFKYQDSSEDEDEVYILSDSSSEGNCSEEEGPKPKRAKSEKSSVKSLSKLGQELVQAVKRPQAKKRADVERNSPPMSSTQTSADFGVTTEPIASEGDSNTGIGNNQRVRKRYPNDGARKSFPHRSNFVNFHEICKKK